MNDSKPTRWIVFGGSTADAVNAVTNSPGLHSLASSALPPQLHGIPGASSYYASVFPAPVPTTQGVTVGGALLVARSDDALTKNYLYGFGTNSAGDPVFGGPFKNFDGHHVSSGQTFDVSSIFAQGPYGQTR